MDFLTRDAMFNIQRRSEVVELPEIDGKLVVMDMSLAERAEFDIAGTLGDSGQFDAQKFAGLVIIATARDAGGNRLFEYGDLPRVLSLPERIVRRVADAGMRVCGFVESTESLAKN